MSEEEEGGHAVFGMDVRDLAIIQKIRPDDLGDCANLIYNNPQMFRFSSFGVEMFNVDHSLVCVGGMRKEAQVDLAFEFQSSLSAVALSCAFLRIPISPSVPQMYYRTCPLAVRFPDLFAHLRKSPPTDFLTTFTIIHSIRTMLHSR